MLRDVSLKILAKKVAKDMGIQIEYLGKKEFRIHFENEKIIDLFDVAARFLDETGCAMVKFTLCEVEVSFSKKQGVIDAMEDWYLKFLKSQIAPIIVSFEYNGTPFLKYLLDRMYTGRSKCSVRINKYAI